MNLFSKMRPSSARRASSLQRQSRISSKLVKDVIFPVWVRDRHPGYAESRAALEESQFWPKEKLKVLQRERLTGLLQHAFENCSFYRERMEQTGIRPAERIDFDVLTALPRLTKREIQDHQAEMLATNIPASARMRNQTGGSTGSPLQFYVDKRRFATRMASTHRHDAWADLYPGDWVAFVWGARLDQLPQQGLWNKLRNEWLYRRIELNTSLISDADWTRFIDQCRRRKPRFMIAYAQSAVLVAKYFEAHGISDIHFQSIITTAEVLLSEQREYIERVLGAEVFDRYGCREISIIASECKEHRGLHVNAESILVEIVPDANLPASLGKVLVTDLLNYSQPLIRYEIGDASSWLPEQTCPCGRGLPLLSPVQGRSTDFLTFADRHISGPALTLVVADMADVRQVQFVQTGTSSVTLRVVPGNNYGDATKQELRKRLRQYLGEGVKLEIEETESVLSEASGKYRFVISEVTSRV